MPRANPFAIALVAVSLLAPARAEEGALPQPGKEADGENDEKDARRQEEALDQQPHERSSIVPELRME